MAVEKNVSQFDADVVKNEGYVYTTNNKLSSLIANQRQSDSILEMIDLKGKRVLDVGCGDGTYTLEFLKQRPKSILGVDASRAALKAARKKAAGRKNVRFKVLDIYKIDSFKEHYDVAIVRGVLHHLYDAPRAIEALSKVADVMVVVEPNGYNPVLKLIERFSKYHVEHEEKSYFPFVLRGWFRNSGGRVERLVYRGLVPMFCPDWMAKPLKKIEPFFEGTPLVRQVSCAVGVYRVDFRKKPSR